MSTPASHRETGLLCNALAGILALRMDFVDRDQCGAAAVSLWVRDRSRPFVEESLEPRGAKLLLEFRLQAMCVPKHLHLKAVLQRNNVTKLGCNLCIKTTRSTPTS